MNVQTLRELLENLPADMEIYLSSDDEGNSYRKLDAVDSSCFYDDGDITSTSFSAQDMCMTESEWEDIKNSKPKVLVFW